ncbi:ABC transporter substrate-binding protein [Cryobacterium sp. PH29-G1]|uniref:ABC transporter substrate-binding protein n=1 Tax=Cryobacterium sp. PH29-G1 TaxID=3046211 RepID=UPI0024BB6D19|nr:ABC transporter substrate-binding protein [Cryobacterium sp. PH29-G1]MDJ0349906.1 ABC transporter substrate-binding protein [Cryobacterium sp. PH29-G1]
MTPAKHRTALAGSPESSPARSRTNSSTNSRAKSPATSVAIALALVVSFALTGCFTGTSGSGASGTDASGPGASDRISLAMLQPPRSGLSPLSDDAFKLSRWSTGETLVALDAQGDAQPALATSWQQTDALTWRFDLRPDVTFHDGTLLTAEQVAVSLTAAAESTPKPRILDGVILTATARGPLTVEVHTGTEDPLIPQRLSSPQLTILAAAAYSDDGTVNPIQTGTGPFVLAAVDGTTGATLNRFDDYWGSPAAASGIDVSFVPDGTARAAALRTGTADIVEAIPVGQVSQIDAELVHEVPMPRTNTLYLNTETGPFADPAVRAAARVALENATLVELVYEGRADAAAGLLGPALDWAAGERTTAFYTEIMARRAEAAAVDGVRITLGTFTDRAELPEVAVQLEQQLEAVGFVVDQDVREYQYIEADALAGAFDAFLLSRATVLDSGDPVAYLYSDFACSGSFNIAQFCDETVDAALDSAGALAAGSDRRTAIMHAEALILASDAALPLLHERVLQGEGPGVTGVARDPRERALITNETRVTD